MFYYKDVPVEDLTYETSSNISLSDLSDTRVGKQLRFYDAAKVTSMKTPSIKKEDLETVNEEHLTYIKQNLLFKAKLSTEEPSIEELSGSAIINEAILTPENTILDTVKLAPTEIIPVTSTFEWLYRRPKKDTRIKYIESSVGTTVIDGSNLVTKINPAT